MKRRFWLNLGIIFTMLFSTFIGMKAPTVSAKENSPKEYQIYPIPHKVTYHEGSTKLDKAIQVIYDETIDSVTRKKVETIFKQNGYPTPIIGTQVAEDKINILVGTKDSNGPVDSYAAGNLNNEGMDFTKIDAYQLKIQKNTITILGKDTDASFYGVVTLNAILAQAAGKEVRNLTIQDYANTKIRGFIEGYYGIPWSNEDRMSLMKFGGKFKMTSYVFAPKDDPFHREKWAEVYPPEKLAEIKEMAEVGNENKTRFVWTISPLAEVAKISQTGGDPMLKLQENTDKMLAKFEQLYDVGVRQFGVLGDDVGSLPRDYVIALMHSVSDWAKAKGDVYDILYCPASYNSSWAWNPAELNAYEQGFDKNIQIFWTGSTTCAPIVQSTIDTFKTRSNGGVERRDPLFWLNWPVNDVDMSRVFLGKGEMLQPGIKNLAGAVTNPMQEAEASTVALFAIADYTWNTETFNAQKSWEDGFNYIEPDAAAELHTLAKHMSDADPNGLKLSESEDIKSLLDSITSKVNNGSSLKDSAPEAVAELQKIADAANGFLAKTKNEKLKKELEPFVKALRDMVLADIEFIKTDLAIGAGNKAETWDHFAKATALRQQSLNYDRPLLSGTMKTTPAKKRLQPFTTNLENKISPKVAALLDLEKAETKASIFTNVDAYKNVSINEEKSVTSITNAGAMTLHKDEYFGIKLSRVKDVTEIQAPSEKGLTLETSLNGIKWEKVISNTAPSDARYVRLLNKQAKPVEFTLDIFKVTSFEVEPKSVKETNYTSMENPLALFDGDFATPGWLKNSQLSGKYITFDMGQEITLNSLKAVIAEGEHDYPRHAILEASLDGNEWTTVMTFGSQDGINEGEATNEDRIDAIFDKLEAPYRTKEVRDLDQKIKYLRFKVTRTKVGSDKWIRMQELVINDGASYPENNDPTITTNAAAKLGYAKDNLVDGKLNTKFMPAGTEAGEILYHIGEAGTSVTGITILEDPNSLSGSKISVRTSTGWRKLGTIESGYQFFDTKQIPEILDLKIEWPEGKIPTIHEIKIDKK
ncbi:beta-N-acetylglucosaminidase domain-containing protein [Bacillus salipaludis]|uniref:Beta-N-acetylglucosaminidase domain-containing protein n=1 Tax=Bacillus salipaludis TaxID=2547811 RepID=A0ABW8RHN9_9BACI